MTGLRFVWAEHWRSGTWHAWLGSRLAGRSVCRRVSVSRAGSPQPLPGGRVCCHCRGFIRRHGQRSTDDGGTLGAFLQVLRHGYPRLPGGLRLLLWGVEATAPAPGVLILAGDGPAMEWLRAAPERREELELAVACERGRPVELRPHAAEPTAHRTAQV